MNRQHPAYTPLNEALTRRYGPPREYGGMSVWVIWTQDGRRGRQLHAHCGEDDCSVWIADEENYEAPTQLATVKEPDDVPNVLDALDRFLHAHPTHRVG